MRFVFFAMMLGLAACGAEPKSGSRSPSTDMPRPGWHGCTTCQIMACLAQTPDGVEQLRLQLETPIEYTSAILEVAPANSAGASAVKLSPDTWLKKKAQVVAVQLDSLPAMKSASAWKDAKAQLRLKWLENGKPVGKTVDLPVITGACPR